MSRHRSGYVRVDVTEILDEIEDDVLLEEVCARKLSPARPGETVDLDIVREAYQEMQRGRITEARSILDRLLFPKWKSPDDCAKQLARMI